MKNILIVKLSAIGDVVHALPVAAALKRHLPDCRITWVVEKAAYELIADHQYIDEVILFDKAKCKSFVGFLRYAPDFISELRRRKFNVALDLQGLLKSALIALCSGAEKRYVYENSREGSDKLAKRIVGRNAHGGHVTERYLDVVRYLCGDFPEGSAEYGLNISPAECEAADKIAIHAGLDLRQKYVALILGANWPNKIWPQEHFAVLADKLYENGLIPIVVGGPQDRQLAKLVTECSKIPPIDLTGKTTLRQLAAILQKATAVVGGDTGPLHLATALGTPVVELMGPTDEARNGPYGLKNIAIVARHDCAGCWKRKCLKGIDCLAVIKPEDVLAQLLQISQSGKSGGE